MCRVRSRAGRGASGRHGLTIVEVLVSATITASVVGTLAALAMAVQQNALHQHDYGQAVQHARVALDRIARSVETATATANYPGAVVVFEQVGAHRFPDTLVVWRPAAAPTNPAGPPLARELVMFCPNPTAPHELVEITFPGNATPVELNDTLNTSSGRALVQSLKTSTTAVKTVLTPWLRTAMPGASGALRGAVRFEAALRPAASQWAENRAGTRAWDAIDWPQGIFSPQVGLRQVWVQTELHLQPGGAAATNRGPVPFFGSAALWYEMNR